MTSNSHGFTLIEVMVVVAIIGILSAIAIPQYTAYIARGNRAEAKAALLEGAAWMQRRFTEQNQYPTSLPTGYVTNVPASGSARYTLSLPTATSSATAFVLLATPAGTMTNDDCATFTVDNFGAQGGSIRSGSSMTVAQCWGR